MLKNVNIQRELTSAKPTMIFPTAAEDIFGEQLRVTRYRPSSEARPWRNNDSFTYSLNTYAEKSKLSHLYFSGISEPLSCYKFTKRLWKRAPGVTTLHLHFTNTVTVADFYLKYLTINSVSDLWHF